MPKRVITANDTEVAKRLQEAVQPLRLMEKPNITTICKDINERYGVNCTYFIRYYHNINTLAFASPTYNNVLP